MSDGAAIHAGAGMSDIAVLKPMHDVVVASTRTALMGMADDALLCAAGVALSAWAIVAAERLGLETAREMLHDVSFDITERAMGARP